MLIRLAIDPDGLDLTEHDENLRAKLTEDLIRLWHALGILYIGSPQYESSALRRAIEQLPPGQRQRWTNAVAFAKRHKLIRSHPVGWDGAFPEGTASWLNALSECVDLAAVRKAIYSESSTSPSPNAPVEISRLDCLTEADSVRSAQAIRTGQKCSRGEQSDRVWDRLFRDYVQHFDRCCVVDRYCVQRLQDAAVGHSGIEGLLSRIDNSPSSNDSFFVTIYSSIARSQTIQEVAARLRRFTANLGSRIARIDLHVCNESDFGRIAHYRYVRFQEHHCVILDQGVEILEGNTLRKTHPYSFTSFDDTLRRDETELRFKSQRIEILARRAHETGASEGARAAVSQAPQTKRAAS